MKFRYLNRATGNEIIVPCPVEGPDWELIEEPENVEAETQVKPARKTARKKAKETEDDG